MIRLLALLGRLMEYPLPSDAYEEFFDKVGECVEAFTEWVVQLTEPLHPLSPEVVVLTLDN